MLKKKSCVTLRVGHLEISASTFRHLQHQHRYSNAQIQKLFFTQYKSHLELKFSSIYFFVKINVFCKLQPICWRLAIFLENE